MATALRDMKSKIADKDNEFKQVGALPHSHTPPHMRTHHILSVLIHDQLTHHVHADVQRLTEKAKQNQAAAAETAAMTEQLNKNLELTRAELERAQAELEKANASHQAELQQTRVDLEWARAELERTNASHQIEFTRVKAEADAEVLAAVANMEAVYREKKAEGDARVNEALAIVERQRVSMEEQSRKKQAESDTARKAYKDEVQRRADDMVETARKEALAAAKDMTAAIAEAKSAHEQTKKAQEELEATRLDLEKAREEVKKAREEAEKAQQEVEKARDEAENAQEEAEKMEEEVKKAREDLKAVEIRQRDTAFNTEAVSARRHKEEKAALEAEHEKQLAELMAQIIRLKEGQAAREAEFKKVLAEVNQRHNEKTVELTEQLTKLREANAEAIGLMQSLTKVVEVPSRKRSTQGEDSNRAHKRGTESFARRTTTRAVKPPMKLGFEDKYI